MVPVFITGHAVERYVERVGGTPEAAMAALSAPVIRTAANFGARVVRMPRCRILMRFAEGAAFVTTVVPLSHLPQQLMPHAQGGPPPARLELAPFLTPMENAHG